MPIPLCCSCFKVLSAHLQDAVQVEEYYQCCYCFGLMDSEFYKDIVKEADVAFKEAKLDGSTFVLAVNFPVSQHFREKMIQKLMGKAWTDQEMSPKSRSTFVMMHTFRQLSELRPSLHSDTIMTVTFENDEFNQKDIDYFMCHRPQQFLKTGRKRQASNHQDIDDMFTKVKVQSMLECFDIEMIKKFTFTSPSKKPAFKVSFKRDEVYIAGRYCKFARGLPQSPWSPDKDYPRFPGYSVSEIICDPLKEYFRANETRFIASGREDIDVRMLGSGRPFAVALVNAKRWADMYSKDKRKEVLEKLRLDINKSTENIMLKGELKIVNQEQMKELNVGQDAKKKSYYAFCYSYHPLTQEMVDKFNASIPVTINQWTPVRVLVRRALMERPRTIHSGKIVRIDDHYFRLYVETQAGTYIKEFVNGDFGRTTPSVANLLGFELNDGVSIQDLDVTDVDLEWPPADKK